MSDPHTDLVQSTAVLYGLLSFVAAFVVASVVSVTVLNQAEALTEAARWAGVQALAACLWLLVVLLPPRVEPAGGAS